MATNEGQVNRTGIRILKISDTEVLQVPNSGGAVAFLHFVDGNGDTIVPEYVPQGLPTYAGPLSGAKYTLVSSADLAALQAQVTALQAKQWVETPIKLAAYTAAAWEHVLVDTANAAGAVPITLPASAPSSAGARIRISDVSSGGSGNPLQVIAAFAAITGGHWASSPYTVASDGFGASLVGASIELVDVGTGWFAVSESCQQIQLL